LRVGGTQRSSNGWLSASSIQSAKWDNHNQETFLLRSTALRCALLVFALATAFSSQAQTQEFIFDTAPFAQCHASTIVELKGNEYLSAWFGGTAEGAKDVAIWSARRTAAGWSKPVELAREPGTPTWNPVLFHAKTGRLWLYYKFGPSFNWWTAARRWSEDEGRTWSPIEHLPAGILGPIRAKPLVLESGLIVSGTSVESYSSWAAWIERSADNGLTWTKVGPVTLPQLRAAPQSTSEKEAATSIGIIQPVVIALGGKHLRLYARSTPQIARICVADSYDLGETWSDARPLDVRNPNSGIDLVRLRDGRIVLIYNDTDSGRTPLNLAVSTDGEHFKNFAILERDPGEYSYPAIIEGTDNLLHMTYTFNRKTIRYVTFPVAEVSK
jgi:predicted neuraminidase